ncbi:hypothetical protein TNCV_4601231 [Trichonephila clavipes]|nr:hypothetical protein TNCV_4601231 [Trichonephila clavipes]
MQGKRARRHFAQLSEFQRGLIIGMKKLQAGRRAMLLVRWIVRSVPLEIVGSSGQEKIRTCGKTESGATRITTRIEDRRIMRQALGTYSDSFNDTSRQEGADAIILWRTPSTDHCQEDIVRNARVQLTAPSAAIQAHIALSLGALMCSRTIRCLAAGHLRSRRLLRAAHDAPIFASVLSRAAHGGKVNCSGMDQFVFSDESDSISAVTTIVFVHIDPVMNASITAYALQRHTTPTTGLMVLGAIFLQYTVTPSIDYVTLTAQWFVKDILQPHEL